MQRNKLQPMSIEVFYNKIDAAGKALENGDTITQENLREEIKTWKKVTKPGAVRRNHVSVRVTGGN